jgi:glucokinase
VRRTFISYAWTNNAVAQALADIGPVTIASDVQAAALAEATHGAGRGHPSCLFVSLGTGVSHSFTIDGRVHRGATGNAILFGCSPLRHRCAACGEEDERVLEQRGAGPALVRRFIAIGGDATTAEAVIAAPLFAINRKGEAGMHLTPIPGLAA